MQNFVGTSNQCKAFQASLYRFVECDGPIYYSVHHAASSQLIEVTVYYLNEASPDFRIWRRAVVSLAVKAGVRCFDPAFIEGIPSYFVNSDCTDDLTLF